jgi:hypothetical protein
MPGSTMRARAVSAAGQPYRRRSPTCTTSNRCQAQTMSCGSLAARARVESAVPSGGAVLQQVRLPVPARTEIHRRSVIPTVRHHAVASAPAAVVSIAFRRVQPAGPV